MIYYKPILLHTCLILITLFTFNFVKPTNAQEVSCESKTHCAQLCEDKESELQAEAEEGEVWSCSMVDAGSVSVSGSEDQAEDQGTISAIIWMDD